MVISAVLIMYSLPVISISIIKCWKHRLSRPFQGAEHPQYLTVYLSDINASQDLQERLHVEVQNLLIKEMFPGPGAICQWLSDYLAFGKTWV